MLVAQLQCIVSWKIAMCTLFLSRMVFRCSFFLSRPQTFAWSILKSSSFFGVVVFSFWGGAFFLGLKRFFLIFFFFQYVCNRSAWEATDPVRYLINRVAVPTRMEFLIVFGFIGIISGGSVTFLPVRDRFLDVVSKWAGADCWQEFSIEVFPYWQHIKHVPTRLYPFQATWDIHSNGSWDLVVRRRHQTHVLKKLSFRPLRGMSAAFSRNSLSLLLPPPPLPHLGTA